MGGKWRIKCSFTRATRFLTKKEMKYPQWVFNYTMTIEMDKRYDTGKKIYKDAAIINIAVDKPLEKYFIIENQENISLTAKSGETLTDWDEEYNSRIFPVAFLWQTDCTQGKHDLVFRCRLGIELVFV
jgi:hypothetical protein